MFEVVYFAGRVDLLCVSYTVVLDLFYFSPSLMMNGDTSLSCLGSLRAPPNPNQSICLTHDIK